MKYEPFACIINKLTNKQKKYVLLKNDYLNTTVNMLFLIFDSIY